MPTIDPHRFTGLPLMSKATAQDDYSIFIDGLQAGRIMRQARAFGNETWFWTITGPALVQAGMTSSGEAETLDAARQAFRERFDEWLTWATAASGRIYWNDGK